MPEIGPQRMTTKQTPGNSGTRAKRRTAAPRPGAGRGVADRSAAVPAAAPVPMPFSAIELRQISTHITTQWFLPVEGNRLTLLEIDPWRVHAYWHVAEADLAAARSSLPGGGDAALVLRFTDLSPGTPDTAPPHPRFDIEVQHARNNWYVGLWRDAKHYSAELGLRAPDGRFVALVRSNEVVTPRSGPSAELDFRRLEVRSPRALPVHPLATGTGDPDRLLRDLFPRRLLPEDDYPLALAETSGVTLDEPPFPALDAGVDVADPVGGGWGAGADSDAPGGPAGASVAPGVGGFPVVDAAEIDPYRAVAREAKARMLAHIGSGLPPVAEETVSATDVDLQAQPLPLPVPPADGASMGQGGDGHEAYALGRPEPPAGTRVDWWPELPLEAVLSGVVSSPGQGASPVEVAVELVVHGRNSSPSPLTLCGERVQVSADGSFTLRLPLEHGTELAELIRRHCSRYGDKDDG